MTQPKNKALPNTTRLQLKAMAAVKEGTITAEQGFALMRIEDYLKASPDGMFAEMLVALIQGELD